jgi:glycosyltransferase involved in cell wall biosynthesis
MRIAYIGQKGIPVKTGGVERYVEEVATRMVKKGHEVFVYARNNYTEKKLCEYKGVKIIHLPSVSTKNLDAISHTFLATVHALFQNYDIIHYHSIGPTSLSVIPKLFKRKTPLIATFQCQDYFHKKWGLFARAYLRFSEKLTCIVPDKTIAVSQEIQMYAKEKYQKDLVCIPNGAEIKFNHNTESLKDWDLRKNNYILSVSRLIRHKGIHYLIEAFNDLCEKKLNQGKKLVIVGDGSFTDEYVTYLKALAVKNREIIFTGTLSGEKLEQLFSHCFLFVQPSESEGMSLALLEAMGYGKAILISNILENINVLKGSGFVFENKNKDDLKNKLKEILDNPKKVEMAGVESQKIARDFYDWNKIVDQIEVLYLDSLNEKIKGK